MSSVGRRENYSIRARPVAQGELIPVSDRPQPKRIGQTTRRPPFLADRWSVSFFLRRFLFSGTIVAFVPRFFYALFENLFKIHEIDLGR